MSKKLEIPESEIPKIKTAHKNVVLIKAWTNPEGGNEIPAGSKLEVIPELYDLMESLGVIEIKQTKN